MNEAASGAERAQADAKRVRALAAVGRARLANGWLRLGASTIVAAVATSLVDTIWPLLWLGGLAVVILIDRAVYARLLKLCDGAKQAPPIRGVFLWTVIGSTYGNILAAMFWFAPYVPGQTLAVFYICGGLANAAATLRASPVLSIAGTGPTIATLFALPITSFILDGAQSSLELMPLVGGVLLLGFCVNLWRSLVAADAAQIHAEEAVLRERQTAAAAAAAKTDMIARMNSEMRTPMQALIGAAEHLRRAATTPQARAQIANLAQAGEVLKLVLDDFGDLDRLENGLVRIEPKPTNLRELVRGVVSAFRAAAQDKHLELFLDVGAGVPEYAVIDARRVRQILFNLVANAVRYTITGGVRVRLSAQAVGEERVRLHFQVADTGPGMSKTQLAAIFGRERFCADGDGPGLGLSISLRLARLMGGYLSARSDADAGSVFSFALDAPITGVSAPQESRQLAR